MQNSYSYFQNRECRYFPCHKREGEEFNCLFCYCPLYVLGEKCGGDFSYTDKGIKDCSNCVIPHRQGGYQYIMARCNQLIELAKKREERQE